MGYFQGFSSALNGVTEELGWEAHIPSYFDGLPDADEMKILGSWAKSLNITRLLDNSLPLYSLFYFLHSFFG